MAKLSKDGHTVETSHAPEIVSLRAQGYTDAREPATVIVSQPAPEVVQAPKPFPKSSK